MDAELIAIGRVRRAVAALGEPAQMRVLQYVIQGMFEAAQERQRAEQAAFVGGSALGGVRMSEARQSNAGQSN